MKHKKGNPIPPVGLLALLAAIVLAGCAPAASPATPAMPEVSPLPTDVPTSVPPNLPVVFHEGFESGLEGWEQGADVPQDPNNPGQPVAWSIDASDEQAVEGTQSARFVLDGSQDDGTIWLARELQVPADTELVIDLTFDLWSTSESFNRLANVAAYAGLYPPEVETDFDTSQPANLAEGWQRYFYNFPVRSDAQGRLWVAVGISVVWETEVTYFIDGMQLAVDSVGPQVKPPPAVLAVDGQEQVAGIGSYCWSDLDQGLSICADTIGIITPEQPLLVSPAFTAQFRLAPDGIPSELALRVIAVSPEDELVPVPSGTRAWPGAEGTQVTLPLKAEPEVDLALEPGLYVLYLFARWEALGDVSYGFLLEVPDSDEVSTPAGLLVEETAIVAADIIVPYRIEYWDYLGEEILARIEGLRSHSDQQQLARNNEALAPFGFRLESHFDEEWHATFYDLYKDGQVEPVLANLWHIWPVSVSASRTDFVLPAENAPNTQPTYLLIRPDTVEDWYAVTNNMMPPGFVGDQLAMAVTLSSDLPNFAYEVQLDGQAVYSGEGQIESTYELLRGFCTWDGHWALEANDHVILDGQDLGESLGYDAVFDFHILHGQPFYFFEQEGLIRLSYAGETLPNVYHEVVHHQCCEASAFNVEAHANVLWFHARVDDIWSFVEAGVYDGEMAGTQRYTAPEGWSFRWPAHWEGLDADLGFVQETATGKTVTFASQPTTQDELEEWLDAEIARKLAANEADNSLTEPLSQSQDGDLTVYRYAILSKTDGTETLLLSAVFFDGGRRYEFHAAVPPVAEEEFNAILASFSPVSP